MKSIFVLTDSVRNIFLPILRIVSLVALIASAGAVSACTSISQELKGVMPAYTALPGHKALVINTHNDRFVWASDKGSQLDAIQMVQILCTHASDDPDACYVVYVDDHKIYDPVKGVSLPPDSHDLADVLYQAGADTQGTGDSVLSSIGEFFGL